MNDAGVPVFLYNLKSPEGTQGHINQSTLGLAIIERLDYIAKYLADKGKPIDNGPEAS